MIADGFWKLWCEACEAHTMHHVWPNEGGQRVAECQDCDASWTLRGPPKTRTGHPRGARGRFKIHDWTEGHEGLWFRQCMPAARSRAAKRIVKAEPSAVHALCSACAARRGGP